MIQQAFGDQRLVELCVSMAWPIQDQLQNQLTMMNTQGDPEAAQFLKLFHEFKSSSVRIDVGHSQHC